MPKSSNDDNLAAAIDHVMENEELTIAPNTGSEPGNPASAQVLIRTTVEERDYWKRAAEFLGCSVTEFARQSLTHAAEFLLECQHPIEFRKSYPWSETCMKCGERLRG
jgi:hypothetical protein